MHVYVLGAREETGDPSCRGLSAPALHPMSEWGCDLW